MPISADDQARLPPMTKYDELAERQRLAEMKEFRKYLVDTDSTKCLVKLFQHVAKNEMRLDNPSILKEFLSEHVEVNEASIERDRVEEENAMLKDRNADLQAQVATLSVELRRQQRLSHAKGLWQHLVSADFWQGQLDDDTRAAGLPLRLLFQRFVGQKVDKKTKQILVNLLLPYSLDEAQVASASPMDCESFCDWVAGVIPEDLYSWCVDDLLPRLDDAASPTEPPYENELLQLIRDSGFYPSPLDQVAVFVSLDPNLAAFLDAAAGRFRS
jgi:hypothetical protein